MPGERERERSLVPGEKERERDRTIAPGQVAQCRPGKERDRGREGAQCGPGRDGGSAVSSREREGDGGRAAALPREREKERPPPWSRTDPAGCPGLAATLGAGFRLGGTGVYTR